jgi:hypothetical protein
MSDLGCDLDLRNFICTFRRKSDTKICPGMRKLQSRHDQLYSISYIKHTIVTKDKCDLDLGGRDMDLVHDMSSLYAEHMWQVILKSVHA